MTQKSKTGMELIHAERERQIAEEGYTPAHDDEHNLGQLALAAACYAAPRRIYALRVENDGDYRFFDPFPWRKDKRESSRRIDLLVKAGALIAAEIDRLIRLRDEDESSWL